MSGQGQAYKILHLAMDNVVTGASQPRSNLVYQLQVPERPSQPRNSSALAQAS
jgi:hypothetical protein